MSSRAKLHPRKKTRPTSRRLAGLGKVKTVFSNHKYIIVDKPEKRKPNSENLQRPSGHIASISLPSRTARRNGYFSKSHWKKRGRIVIPQDPPALAVANAWQTRSPKDDEIILAWNDYNEYLVTNLKFDRERRSKNAWPVYCEAETTIPENHQQVRAGDVAPYVVLLNNAEPKAEEDAFSIIETTAGGRPHDTTPYVVQTNNVANNDEGPSTGVWLTVPKRLVPPEGLENEVYYYCHTILQGVFNKKHDLDRTVRINAKLMRTILGGARKETRARWWLLDNGIIYTDHIFREGNFSKSYGLNPLYARQLTRWEVTNPKLARRLRLARLQRTDLQREQQANQSAILDYLTDWAKRVTIDLDACRRELAETGNEDNQYLLSPAQSIDHRGYYLTRDDYGRVHSPFTQLWRPFRRHLRFDGQPLHEVDVRNSQIVFLVKLLKEHLLREGLEPSLIRSSSRHWSKTVRSTITCWPEPRKLSQITYFGRRLGTSSSPSGTSASSSISATPFDREPKKNGRRRSERSCGECRSGALRWSPARWCVMISSGCCSQMCSTDAPVP
jgi:hypothetical protein